MWLLQGYPTARKLTDIIFPLIYLLIRVSRLVGVS